MLLMMKIPVMAASWLTLMSSSPSEMCLSAASVPAVTVLLLELLVLLVLDSSEELEGDAGLRSGLGGGGGGEGEGAGRMEGGGG